MKEPIVKANGWRNFLIIISSFAALATIHSLIVVPAIIAKAGEVIDNKIENHSNKPHIGSVTTRELDLVINHMGTMKDDIMKRFDNIERRIDRISGG